MLPHVYRITKYNPADRDERGHYVGGEDSISDHGPVEAAYLEAVAAFAHDTGVERLDIREPEVAGLAHFGLEPPVEGYGLAGLFPADLSGYHDGAQVPVTVGLELVRAMLRDNGAWCRLEVQDRFFVHVGYDQYVYVGSIVPCERAQALTGELGLFPERIDASPYEPEIEPGEQCLADDDFWAAVSLKIPGEGALLLQECYVGNASRWYRLTFADIDRVRAGLTPRARVTVRPDLSSDLDAVVAAFPEEGSIELVWQDPAGHIASRIGGEEQFAELAALLAHARAAAVIPLTAGDHHPLFAAVLPDTDGVLRARWRTEPTSSE
ncbi:RNA-binding protein [Actinomadura sp. NPDC048032]|uniref:RNA-binding protein n=1 Tax=Actinomadura sp. NPDC048032 TaxID=3155747 RepID=UPI0033DD177F